MCQGLWVLVLWLPAAMEWGGGMGGLGEDPFLASGEGMGVDARLLWTGLLWAVHSPWVSSPTIHVDQRAIWGALALGLI